MDRDIACALVEAITKLSAADSEIAKGMEALATALAGEGRKGHDNVAKAIREVADAIMELTRVYQYRK
jgi:translation elongation factor EF-1beta